MEHEQAKKIYRWLWWSPLLTIPTLLILMSWNPGHEYYCCNNAIEERITGIVAVIGSALWHLTLLKPSRNKENFFIRWHGKQALTLAGLRTAIPLAFAFLYGFELEILCSIPILIVVWLVGTIWGQNQAIRGDCSLARWFGHADELPGPPVETQVETPEIISDEEEIEFLVKTLRFNPDKEARTKALLKLDALGVVEDL
jgi:hypothetical protein